MMQIKIILLLLSFLGGSCFSSFSYAQGCKYFELRKKVRQVAQAQKVDENELLSIIAHESNCHYYVIAWNLPRKPKKAQSKFFTSLNEANSFSQSLINTKKYRVDVGIGQINYEAHIRPKGWRLEDILDPSTALNFASSVLKERAWANYHSNNPVYAKKWRRLALAALHRVSSNSGRNLRLRIRSSEGATNFVKKNGPLVVYNSKPVVLKRIENEKRDFVFLSTVDSKKLDS